MVSHRRFVPCSLSCHWAVPLPVITTRVLCAFMPGLHSPGKLADRRRRAIDRRYVGQRPPGIVGKKFAAVASTVAVSSSADHIEDDPLRLNDPWACYTAATSCRGLPSVFSTASCGAPCSNVGPPAAAFNASAKVFAPADAAVELASNSWEQLAFAQQHTISSLTQQSLFLSHAVSAQRNPCPQPRCCAHPLPLLRRTMRSLAIMALQVLLFLLD